MVRGNKNGLDSFTFNASSVLKEIVNAKLKLLFCCLCLRFKSIEDLFIERLIVAISCAGAERCGTQHIE